MRFKFELFCFVWTNVFLLLLMGEGLCTNVDDKTIWGHKTKGSTTGSIKMILGQNSDNLTLIENKGVKTMFEDKTSGQEKRFTENYYKTKYRGMPKKLIASSQNDQHNQIGSRKQFLIKAKPFHIKRINERERKDENENNSSNTVILQKAAGELRKDPYLEGLDDNFDEIVSAEDEAVMGEEDLSMGELGFRLPLGSQEFPKHREDYVKNNRTGNVTDFKEAKTQKILEQQDELGFSGDKQESLENLHQLNKSHRIQVQKVHAGSSKYGPWYPSPYPVWQQNVQNNMPRPEPTDIKFQFNHVADAEQKGAVCLDGSEPGFYFRKGFASGASKWIIYLQGGAWCSSIKSCYWRSKTHLGTSNIIPELLRTSGLFSPVQKENPDFYNWNVASVKYCDGASFSGNRSEPINFNGALLYFRGKRILSALIDDLMERGMKYADNIIFSGTSAGGLAAMLNADYFRSRIPEKIPVFVLSDAGVFVDAPSINGPRFFRHQMQRVFKLHQCSGEVSQACISDMKDEDNWKCLFPKYFLPHVKTPLFIINPLYDSWQLGNILKVKCVKNKMINCSDEERDSIKRFKQLTLNALDPVNASTKTGLFADSCILHGQVYSLQWQKVKVKGTSMYDSFTSWIKSQQSKILIDSDEYPTLNPYC